MKRFTISILVSVFAITLFAQRNSITIGSQSANQRFWVFIDDVLQNQYSVSALRIEGMNVKQYRIRVEMDNVLQDVVGQSVIISPKNRSNNYLILYRNGDYSFRRTNYNINPALTLLYIAPNYKYYNGYNSYLYPGFGNPSNYWGKTGKKYSSGTENNDPNDYYNERNNDYNKDNNTYNNGNYQNQNYGNGGYKQGDNYNNNRGNENDNRDKYNDGYVPCMSTGEFNQALNSIKNDAFEAGKLNKAKLIVSKNNVCTAQVMQIANLFTMESNKLEFAKYAYPFCADKNKYYLVTDVFSFQSSKDELLRYIK